MFHEKIEDFRIRYGEVAYAVFRIVFGLMFITHGLMKWGVFKGAVAAPSGLMLVASAIEIIGGLLLALGLFTSIVAFIAAGEMAVAFFMGHVGSALGKASGFAIINPLANGGEAAVLFCFAWLLVFFFGPGKYSIDARGSECSCECGESCCEEPADGEKTRAKSVKRKKK